MNAFAYKVVSLHCDSESDSEKKVNETLNEYGSKGYRVINVETISNGTGRRIYWTLERAGVPTEPHQGRL